MQIAPETPRKERQIGQKADEAKGLQAIEFKVQVPTPFQTGHVCTAGEADILNQTLAENVSNNLRAKLIRGFELTAAVAAVAASGDQPAVAAKPATYRPYTPEEAQALVDTYIAGYEPGVRTGGGGGPRITDPVEREAIALAGERVEAFLEKKGLKKADVDWKAMRAALFEKNRDQLMKEAKRIVDARVKAVGQSQDLTDDLMDFLPGAQTDGAEGGESEQAEAA